MWWLIKIVLLVVLLPLAWVALRLVFACLRYQLWKLTWPGHLPRSKITIPFLWIIKHGDVVSLMEQERKSVGCVCDRFLLCVLECLF